MSSSGELRMAGYSQPPDLPTNRSFCVTSAIVNISDLIVNRGEISCSLIAFHYPHKPFKQFLMVDVICRGSLVLLHPCVGGASPLEPASGLALRSISEPLGPPRLAVRQSV